MDGLSVTLAYSRRRRNERSQEYLSSMLTTWPCRLHCASLDFHPPGDPSTWLHQTASKRREAGANPHKAVYQRCSAELNRTASFIKSDVFVKRWPDLGFRFELGLIGVSCLVHRANWGGFQTYQYVMVAYILTQSSFTLKKSVFAHVKVSKLFSDYTV